MYQAADSAQECGECQYRASSVSESSETKYKRTLRIWRLDSASLFVDDSHKNFNELYSRCNCRRFLIRTRGMRRFISKAILVNFHILSEKEENTSASFVFVRQISIFEIKYLSYHAITKTSYIDIITKLRKLEQYDGQYTLFMKSE